MATDWEARYRERSATQPRPAAVLTDFDHLLPASGDALDLACGLGGNALHLARHGLITRAWDSAATAIDRLAAQARVEGLALTAEVRDVVEHPPAASTFDVIVVSRFLDRALCPALAAALRPGGLLFYETFTRAGLTRHGPQNDQYRLADNELLALFPALRVRVYRDENRAGATDRGLRDLARLVAQRPVD
ncbi:class I SAM-dependent methyltransferase [Halofilum ochraceum]|uniref:class I SAM-dependent methyltransferase n=1 Tax=Halofilum ochraceum TaxID=1611323 RepID=UPI0009F1E6AF|nr:methyltransferase domain-containing protein [Halofilum ochraceum]